MTAKKPDKKSIQKLSVEKDDIIQVVVIADTFNNNFAPASTCPSLFPVVNKKLLDYTLEWLNMSGVNEVILFYTSNINDIKDYVKNKTYLSIDIKILVSENCYSLGDALRALDRYAVIRNTFILISVDVIGNVNFKPIIEKFKNIKNQDKGVSMMVLFKEMGNQRIDLHNKNVIAFNSKHRIIHYQIQDCKGIELPMDVVLEQDFVEIRNDLSNSGVAICSIAVPPLFTDNFDFQTLNDFIRGILINEEILLSTVYCEILNQDHYIGKVSNWPMYQVISQDIIRRWTYPIVLDLSEKYSYRKNNIYLKNVTCCKDCKLGFDVVIGNNTKLSKNVSVDKSVIGSNCKIGDNVIIENSFIFDNVTVEENTVIRFSVVAENCYIKRSCVLDNNCILGSRVTLKNATKISNISLISSEYVEGKNLAKFSDHCHVYKSTITESSDSEDDEVLSLVTSKCITDEFQYDDTSSESSTGSSISSPIVLDDIKIFYSEVIDSLTRGYEDKLKCENLILEINSSRYAYNVTVNEVNFNLIRAILNIEDSKLTSKPNKKEVIQHALSKFNYFTPVIKNYIKNNIAQRDCLLAIEDSVRNENLFSALPNIVHFLYDKNILSENEILSWYNKISKTNINFMNILNPFIIWLSEADEESENDSN